MTTLTHAPHATACGGSAGVATYNSDGCTGRCDARCYEATAGSCNCICGGLNHGAGVERATENTRELAEEWIAAWKLAHSDTTYWMVPAAQLPLPLGILKSEI